MIADLLANKKETQKEIDALLEGLLRGETI